MKKLLVLLCLGLSPYLHAQFPVLDWVRTFGNANNDHGISVVTDASGNIYSTGLFSGTIDIDPGPSVFNLATPISGIYLQKLDADGNFIWAKKIDMTSGMFFLDAWLHIDHIGNLIISGSSLGTFDADPSTVVFTVPAKGISDIFVIKLDNGGNFLWAKQFGGPSQDEYSRLTIGPNDEIFVTGSFLATIDCDPGPGMTNFTCIEDWDIFICKLDPSGTLVWARQFTGTAADFVRSIAVNAAGEIYYSGLFSGTTDYDPGPATNNLTHIGAVDVAMVKLDASGNFLWAKQLSTVNNQISGFLTLDNNSNIYLTGYFYGTTDLDPGPGVLNLIAFGAADVYVAKLDPSGNSIWARQLGGTGMESSFNIGLDKDNNVLVLGYLLATTDFDPGPNTFNATSAGGYDAFLCRLDQSGNINGFKQIGGPQDDVCYDFTTDALGDIIMTGSFESTVDFGICASSNVATSVGGTDVYVIKLKNKSASAIIAGPPPGACIGTPLTFTASTLNAGTSPFYQWQVNGSNAGTNASTFTTSALNDGDIVTVIVTPACPGFSAVVSNAVTVSLKPATTSVVRISPFPSVMCDRNSVTFTAGIQNANNATIYQWEVNGVPAGANSKTFILATPAEGDVVKCVVTNSGACLSSATTVSNTIVIKYDASCPLGFYMPTGFTPTRDGRNDLCKPLIYGRVAAYKFALYNRWGQCVFETNKIQEGWDGKIAGVDQNSGVFVWMCSYQFARPGTTA